jgi:hypothetical protein
MKQYFLWIQIAVYILRTILFSFIPSIFDAKYETIQT